MSKQPEYWKFASKIKAREQNVKVYRELTGTERIPADKTYWTLCNYQPNDAGSEIVQLFTSGLLDKHQFVGVDNDAKVIEKNKRWHPEATWHHGDWLKVIRTNDFNPALVYLDTTSFGKPAADVVASTMYLCPQNAVLVVNIILGNHRFQTDPAAFIDNVCRTAGSLELARWNSRVGNFQYNATGRTDMISYVFYKNE